MKVKKMSRIRMGGYVACLAFVAFVASAGAADDMLVYYPNGAAAPFSWNTVANWYVTNSFNILPTTPSGALPTPSQNVLIQAWGGIAPATPVVLGSDETVTVNDLYIGCNGTTSGNVGSGASLTVMSSTLNVSGNLYHSRGNYTYGTLTLADGAVLNVAGAAQIGENNYTTAGSSRIEIDETSQMNVAGLMTVGRRARCIASVVTNRGELVVDSLKVGPASNAYIGTGVVYNVGHLSVTTKLDVGGLGKGNGSGGSVNNDIRSCGTLVLAEGSTMTLGEAAVINVGGSDQNTYGDGILDTSIPIVLKSPQAITIGNAHSSAVHGGKLILRKWARLDNSSSLLEIGNIQYGKATLEMHDDSSITNVTKIRLSNTAKVHSAIEMHDRAVITNIATIRLGETAGSRNGSRGRIFMDGDSMICFSPTANSGEGSGIIFGTTTNNYAELDLNGNARITGLYRLTASTSFYSYEAHLRFGGGRIEFEPHTADNRANLLLGNGDKNAADGVGSISGYGTITRNDLSNPASGGRLMLWLQMHDFFIAADGGGEARDLDLRAFNNINYGVSGGCNPTGTNGWYAVNKGRLLFPRATKLVGYTADNPARFVGEYYARGTNENGEAKSPELVNAFSLAPTTSAGTGGKAYPYAALYAPDRTDYPRGVLRGRDGKVVSVWRIGTCTTGWMADDPVTPWTVWSAMKVTFRYDRTAFDGNLPVKLYRHDGSANGSWQRVARLEKPTEDALISATVTPGEGSWNVGWFALVEQSDAGMVMTIR